MMMKDVDPELQRIARSTPPPISEEIIPEETEENA